MSANAALTRRLFLGSCLAGAIGGRGATAPPAEAAGGKSRVVIARDANLRGASASLESSRLQALLDRAVQTFYQTDSARQAWTRVARPGEIVGLKVNCLAGRGASTNPLLVQAICERLQQAGVPVKNIIVWDRLNSDLESAGFHVSTHPDAIRTIGNDVLGYEDDLSVFGSAGSRLCRTLSQACGVVINLPVLKDHGIAGVTMALKNLFGAIHNPNKYHIAAGDPYVADVFAIPQIRQKVRLTICDATTAQYEGGPSYMPQWSWPFNGLLVASDPVALDQTGWQIIERKRAQVGMKPLRELKREPAYIARAGDGMHRLGSNDPSRIQVVDG